MIRTKSRWRTSMLALTHGATLAGSTALAAQAVVSGAGPTLATADQRRLDQATSALVRDPAIVAAADVLLQHWQALPQAAEPGAAENLKSAVDELVFFAGEVAVQQTQLPGTVAWILSPPYAPGVPGSRFGLDSPDRIYRMVAVDPARSYVIEGRRASVPSNDDFRFEAVEDGLRTLGGLDARDIDVAADGSFHVTLDARPTTAGQRNHLTLPPGTNTVVIRDTLADWSTQGSNRLTFRQSSGAPPPRGSAEQARRLAVALIGKTDTFVSQLLTGSARLPENQLVAKVRTLDQGLPGYIFASGRYKLQRNEALVVTIDPQAAHYTGFMLTDPWSRSLPYWTVAGSLSGKQATPNADGSLTYIVAARDPGYANWVSTGGFSQGIIGVRVENMPLPSTVDAGKVVRESRVVRLNQIAAALPADAARVSLEQRTRELAERQADFRKRVVD